MYVLKVIYNLKSKIVVDMERALPLKFVHNFLGQCILLKLELCNLILS